MADAQGNRYAPYDIEVAGSDSEPLSEDAWFDLFGGITGVKSGGALTFNGLTATLAAIDMRVHGSYLIRVDPWSIASPATAAGANPRRDMLVARRQRTVGSGPGATPGKTFLTLLQGTPAATPAEPTSYDPVNDEPLFSWQVPGNGGTVVTAVRNLRRPAANSVGPRGALCKPVTLSGSLGVGGNGLAVGATPSIYVPANRLIGLRASFQLYIPSGSGQTATVWLERWTAAGVLATAFGGVGKRITATDLYDFTLEAEDQIAAAGTYLWKVAGAMTGGATATVDATATTTVGSIARARTLHVSDAGLIPFT